DALPPIYLGLVPVMAVGFVLSFFLKQIPLRTSIGESAPTPAQAPALAGEAAGPAAASSLPAVPAGAGLPGPAAREEPVPAARQADTGEATSDGQPVSGRVRRSDGRPLEGATVTLIAPSGRQAGRAFSGPDGAYQISIAEPGAYTLIAMAAGYQPHACAVRAG